jgi:HEAT repeat protein
MRQSIRTFVAVALVFALGTVLPLFALGSGPGDFQPRLDRALAGLARYDFGGDVGALTPLTQLVASSRENAIEQEQIAARLATLLGTAAPRGAKDFACRQLAILGTAEAVPALAGLVVDEQLSCIARSALERIPGPAADQALRQALGKVRGKLRIGVIYSIGHRRDENAVGTLAPLLNDSDPATAMAAAVSLGKIGPAAREVLQRELGHASEPLHSAVAAAYLCCADRLLAAEKTIEARSIYDSVARTKTSRAVHVATCRGTILSRKAEGMPLVVEALHSADPDLFALALSLVRQMPGKEIVPVVAEALKSLPADKQVLLLAALADRGDPASAPAALELSRKGEMNVRVAAVQSLARVADASVVPQLAEMAAGSESQIARAALAALASLSDKKADVALMVACRNPDAKIRRAVVEALGLRHCQKAVPALVIAIMDPDESVRVAAITAIGSTASRPTLMRLVEILVDAESPRVAAAAEAAIGAASVRIADREGCAEAVAAFLWRVRNDRRMAILRVLARIGGARAMEAVRASLKDASDDVANTALRLLAEWPDAAAAPYLAEAARTATKPNHRILALRGYLRLTSQGNQPAERKLAARREALGLADRDEEKKLVLGVLGGIPSAEALAMVAASLPDPALKDEAGAAAVAIGEKIVGSHPAQVAQAMKQVLKTAPSPALRQRAQDLLNRTVKKRQS